MLYTLPNTAQLRATHSVGSTPSMQTYSSALPVALQDASEPATPHPVAAVTPPSVSETRMQRRRRLTPTRPRHLSETTNASTHHPLAEHVRRDEGSAHIPSSVLLSGCGSERAVTLPLHLGF